MQPLDLIRHPIVFFSITFQDFVHWYLLEKPVRILKAYWAYAKACNEVFSFGFLLRTLFSPWKQITENYPNKGFDLGRIGQAFTLNIITRIIGCIFRLSAFLIGVFIQLLLLAGFLSFFLAWLLFPVLFVWGVWILIHSFA